MAHLPPTLKVQNMNTFWRLGRFFLRKLNCYLIFRYIYLLTFALYTFLNTKLIISFFIQGLSTQTPVNSQHNMVHRVFSYHMHVQTRFCDQFLHYAYLLQWVEIFSDNFQFFFKLFLRNTSSNFRTYFQHVLLENCIEI